MARKARKTAPAVEPVSRYPRLKALVWIVLMGVWLLLAAALISHDPADWPSHSVTPHPAQPVNWVGTVGAFVSYKLYFMLGPGIWIALAVALAGLVAAACRKAITQPIVRTLGAAIMMLATSALLGMTASTGWGTVILDTLSAQQPEGAGGLVAIFINHELSTRFNLFGTFLILITAFWLGALLAVDQLVLALPKLAARCGIALMSINWPKPVLIGRFGGWRGGSGGGGAATDLEEAPKLNKRQPRVRNSGRDVDSNLDQTGIDPDAGGLGGVEAFNPAEHPAATAVADVEDEEAEVEEVDEVETDEQEAEDEDVAADAPAAYAAEKRFDPEALREKFKNLPINFAPRGKTKAPPPREVDLSGYRFPDIALLEEPESNFTAEMEKSVREQALALESAMREYNIDGEVVGIDTGPVITLYEVRLAPGTKVSRIAAVSSDLARALKAQNIRVVPNMAGRDTIGIEVPNLVKEKVRLKELMTVNAESVAKMKLPMFLGKDASGNPLVHDLASMPHMLIAGTTGSGKSVCMNSIIMSFLYVRRPDELKLVLVDPKMVEMSLFKDIPHLMCPVVTDMSKAAAILEWAVTKMDERYELLAEVGVRDIGSYNELGWEEIKNRMQPANEEEEARIPKKLPYLVFIIDELADLMMTNKEVEGFIVRIAQKARAVGMHLILATQRPQANVVTGLIKSNMPCRVAFKVSSGMDSRIVLDQKGAELLLGQGDMLFLSPRTSKLTRAQGSLVADLEIRQTVKFLKNVAEQNFEPQLVQIKAPSSVEGEDLGERDPLFEDAVRVVLETQRGSVSLLQRRLTIGYSRASRLIEQIADAGIIGTYKGSQAREVNMTLEEWEALQAQAAADAGDPAASSSAEEAFNDDEEADSDVPDEMDDEYRQ